MSFCALFLGGGFDDDALVGVGGLALLAVAVLAVAAFGGALRPPRLGRPALVFLACLAGLAVWVGVSTLWSLSPDRSWGYTNRTLVYLAFALVGVLGASIVPRAWLADGAAALLAAVVAWALLAKCIPALYPDYGRVARLRAPVGYWNELALLCALAVPLGLRLAARRRRALGAVFLYATVVTLLLTYSRVGVVLACAAAAAWLLLDQNRLEGLAGLLLAGGVGAAVFGIALALPGITSDGQPRSVRAHDGGLFSLALLAGAAVVYGLALLVARRPPLADERRRRVERGVGRAAIVLAVAAVAIGVVFAGRIWGEFTNPVTTQIDSQSGRLLSANSSNRWTWWSEAWQAFTEHPLGGTGAGTFELTDRRLRQSGLVTTTAPHNVPLQFLSETGLVGFLLYLGVAGAALLGAWRARREHPALAIVVGVFFAHAVVDMDWNFVATCGPLLLLTGALLARPGEQRVRARRPLLAAAAVLLAAASVYSLTAPWLARRALAEARPQQAHTYNPLSTRALIDWAAFEDADGNVLHAARLYNDATSLEPENSAGWYALGLFYWDHRAWRLAFDAFAKAWTYDRFGPAGTPCGLLDQARHKVLRVWPPSCPGGRPASSP